MYPKIVKTSAYGRVYEVEKGIFFPSVTTVLKYGLPTPEFLMKWMIEQSGGSYEKHLHHSGEASEIGTTIHKLIERIISGEQIEISDNPLEHVRGRGYYPTYNTSLAIRKGLQSFMAFWGNNKPEVEDIEVLLYSTNQYEGQYMFPFCGRCDLIAKLNGTRWLLDFKTSKQVKDVLNYKLQLTMYTMLWNELHPDSPIEKMGIVWCKKDFRAGSPPKSVLDPIEYKYDPKLVHNVYNIFQETYDGFDLARPRPKKEVPRIFSLAE